MSDVHTVAKKLVIGEIVTTQRLVADAAWRSLKIGHTQPKGISMWTYKIKFKPSTDEYVVRFYLNGREHKPARYYATDKQEAEQTGRADCQRMNTNN